MGPYYDRATLDRIETDIERDRMIELIRMRQGFRTPGPRGPILITTVLIALMFVPML